MTIATGEVIRNPSPRGLVIRQSRPSEVYWGGWLVGRRRGSKLCEVVSSSSPRADLIIEGVAERIESPPFTASSTTDGGGGAIDSITRQPQNIRIVNAPTGWFDTGSSTNAITEADLGNVCYAYDNNTLYRTSLNGQLSPAGYVDRVNAAGKVSIVFDSSLNAAGSVDPNADDEPTARCVVTSLAANSGTTTGTLTADATGAIGAQDGITLAAGDIVFIPEGTTNLDAASDAGLYEVINPGGTGVYFVLRRPTWYAVGAPIMGVKVKVASGSIYGGTVWRADAPKGTVVDTDAPLFWPEKLTVGVTLASGTLSSALATMPVKSATKSGILITSTPTTAPHANTRVWRVSALTPGALGTASIQIVAESAPGTTNASDVGTYTVTVFN